MKKMQYTAPVVNIATVATSSMICTSAGAGASTPTADISYSPTAPTGTQHAD